MAVLHQPHPVNKRCKRVHRVVISPDYQGIGLGTKFLNVVGEHYHSMGFDFSIMTSAKNMIFALKKNPHWVCVRAGRAAKYDNPTAMKGMKNTSRANVFSASFFYK